MTQFRSDNAEGFSPAQLATMNDEYFHALQIAFGDLPDGVKGASDDLIEQIKQTTAEQVLRAHGAAR